MGVSLPPALSHGHGHVPCGARELRVVINMKMKVFLCLLTLHAVPAAQAYEPAGTPEDWPSPIPEQQPYWMVLVDRFEAGYSDNADAYA